MDLLENLPDVEPVEVPKDPCIKVIRKFNSTTRQDRRVKMKVTKEEKLKNRLATGGPAGGDGCGGCGGQKGRGGRLKMGAHTVQTTPSTEPYKPLYYYAAKQHGTPVGTVPYIIYVNTAPLFSEYSSP
ncbi:Secologanin synthase [Hordeum vulgare]|nr:Secologanin synthase [Hordeum vulgare]